VNNGFYEGKQNHIALEIIKNWCEHTGVKFGGGIGQGAGGMMGETINSGSMKKGPFNNLYRSLELLVKKIESKEPFEIKYLSPYFPRIGYNIMAARDWHKMAYKNGLSKKDIIKKIL